MSRHEIIELIHGTHRDISEQSSIARQTMETARGEGSYDKAFNSLVTMQTTIAAHFAREEKLLDLLETHDDLADQQKAYLREVRAEHLAFLAEFKRLDGIKSAWDDTAAPVDSFVNGVCSLLDHLLVHADKEDAALFPLAGEVLSDEELVTLEG
jgi:hemerythrin-like domain-containing protein